MKKSTTYTAEDFAEASFARHPDGEIAARHENRTIAPWHTDFYWLSDAGMVTGGWVPVREASENDGRVKRLKRHISDLEAIVKRRGEDIERLEAEKAELREQVAQFKADQPITLDAIHDAWETAEVADECNEGDILIHRRPDSPTAHVEIWVSGQSAGLVANTRILHRAPKPERVAAERLAALLVEWSSLVQSGLRSGLRTPPLAEWLAERGVRATTTEGEGEGEER